MSLVNIYSTNKYASESFASNTGSQAREDVAGFTISTGSYYQRDDAADCAEGVYNCFDILPEVVEFKLVDDVDRNLPDAGEDDDEKLKKAEHGTDFELWIEEDDGAGGTTFTQLDESNGVFSVNLAKAPKTDSSAYSGNSIFVHVRPKHDTTVEWDEVVRVELVNVINTKPDTPVNLGDSEITFNTPLYAVQQTLDESDSQITPRNFEVKGPTVNGTKQDSYAQDVIILDDDELEDQVNRNIDIVSTGLTKEKISNGVVSVDVQQGHVTYYTSLLTGAISPTYHADDNLAPIFVVEFELPDDGSITKIKAEGYFGPVEFDAQTFDDFSGFNPSSDTMRIVVLGPEDLSEELRTGHYGYHINFKAHTGAQDYYSRTFRGETEIVNRVDDDLGNNFFGKRWWVDGLDQLVLSDGITAPFGKRDESSAGDGVQYESNLSYLGVQGAINHDGIAIIRGDATTAWYKAAFKEEDATIKHFDLESIDTESLSYPLNLGDSYTVPSDGSLTYPCAQFGNSSCADLYDSQINENNELRRVFRSSEQDLTTWFSTAGQRQEEISFTWEFDSLEADRPYQVFVNWMPIFYSIKPEFNKKVPYTITEGIPLGQSSIEFHDESASEVTVLVDQRYSAGESYKLSTPDPKSEFMWRSLGYFVPENGKIHIEISSKLPDDTFFYGAMSFGDAAVVKHWEYETPDGSINQLFHGEVPSELDYAISPNAEPDSKSFTLIDRFGNRSEFDQDGLLKNRHDGNENAIEYEYTTDDDQYTGIIESITTQGNLETLFNKSDDYLSSITDTVGRTVSYTINNGLLIDITENAESSPTTSFSYENDYLNTVEDANSHTTTINYNGSDHRVSGIDNADSTSLYISPLVTDGLRGGNKIRQAREINKIGTYESSAESQEEWRQPRATLTDERNSLWVYQTDAFGLTTAYAKPITNDSSGQTHDDDLWQWIRNKHGLVDQYAQPAGSGGYSGTIGEIVTSYLYDDDWFLNSVNHPVYSEEYSYGTYGQLTNYSRDGRTTSYELDSFGNVLSMTEGESNGAVPAFEIVEHTTTYTYSPEPSDIGCPFRETHLFSFLGFVMLRFFNLGGMSWRKSGAMVVRNCFGGR